LGYLETAQVEERLLNAAKERGALATKKFCVRISRIEGGKENSWIINVAKDSGVDIDENMMECGMLDFRDR